MKHTVRSYDDELQKLTSTISILGGYSERMIENSVRAIVSGDAGLANQVIADDQFLDEGQREIDDLAILILAKRQPMAQDLREVIGATRIAAELERIGDLSKNMAKRVTAIMPAQNTFKIYRGVEALAQLAQEQLNDVLDNYGSRNPHVLASVHDCDQEIDAKYTALFREMLNCMTENAENVEPFMHLLFCAKNIERIGDHATNIAQIIHYMMTGSMMHDSRIKCDNSYGAIVELNSQ